MKEYQSRYFAESPKRKIEQTADFKELEKALVDIEKIASEFGLDPFPTEFHVVPATTIYEMAGYGIPGRYSHWTHGRDYWRMKTMYDYGLSTIYEMVINSDPAQAFLMDTNSTIENIFVMAHVMGHTDFFKNNYLFKQTSRDMVNAVAWHARRIRSFEEEYGTETVEEFLDAVLSIGEFVDFGAQERLTPDEQIRSWQEEWRQMKNEQPKKSKYKKLRAALDRVPAREFSESMPFPLHPDFDLLGFAADFAPELEDWQREVIRIVRAETMYFRPQYMTKMMNEGWASKFHGHIMEEMQNRGLIEKTTRWWELDASVVTPSKQRLNPYYLGKMMFDYIEDYYNGNLTDTEIAWCRKQKLPVFPIYSGDPNTSPGRKKIFEIRESYDDLSIIQTFFDANIAARVHMFLYDEHPAPDGTIDYVIREKGWQQIRDHLVMSKINAGLPLLSTEDGNGNSRGEWILHHHFEGQELDAEYLKRVLPLLRKHIWKRPIHIETVFMGDQVTFSCDGDKVTWK